MNQQKWGKGTMALASLIVLFLAVGLLATVYRAVADDDNVDTAVTSTTAPTVTTAAPSSSTESPTTTIPNRVPPPTEDTPLPADASGAVQILPTAEGSTIAMGPTDAYLAGNANAFSCGGLRDAAWLQDETLFEASPLLAAYRDRPAYAQAELAFWQEELGDGLFTDMVQAAEANPRFNHETDGLVEDMAAKLMLARPNEPVTTRNFTCKGDVISPNGYLRIGENGTFAAFAGLVMDKEEFNTLLQKHGTSQGDLPVFVYDLGDGRVFVALKAAGCLNNQLKPPGPVTPIPPPTTTTVPPTSTTVPPGTTVPPTSTTQPPTGTTTPPTQPTVPPTTNPVTTTTKPPYTTQPPTPGTQAPPGTPAPPPPTAPPDTAPGGVTPTTVNSVPPDRPDSGDGATNTTQPPATVAPAPAPPNTTPSGGSTVSP